MATNEILQFCDNDTGTNLLTQGEYESDTQRRIGNQPGIARSKFVNKVLRQTSTVAAGIGEFIKNGGNDCTDAQNPNIIAKNIESAVEKYGRPPVAVAEGTADALYATFQTDIKFTNGELITIRAAMANTGAATLSIGIDGTAKDIYKDNNVALTAGDIAGLGHWLELAYDATLDKWCLLNPKQPEHTTIQLVINTIYPVGSIYTSIDSGARPDVLFPNTTWKRLPSGLFLQAADPELETLGGEVEAGLPNVIGLGPASSTSTSTDGIMFHANWAPHFVLSSGPERGIILALSLSRANSIYGNSNTVQPPAIKVSIWKRTA